MWEGVHDRVTEAVFRMEEMGDEEAQAALWAGARATHAAAISATQARQAQTDAAQMQTNAGGEGKKAEPIRNIGAEGRPQRPVPVRQRQEVQELPHEDGGGQAVAGKRVRRDRPVPRFLSQHGAPSCGRGLLEVPMHGSVGFRSRCSLSVPVVRRRARTRRRSPRSRANSASTRETIRVARKSQCDVAELEAREGTTKAVVEGTDQDVFLYPEVLLKGTDIKTAQVAVFEQHGWGVMVEFTPQGTERLRDVTTKNVGKVLVFVVEERVVRAAKISKPIPDGQVAITGKYTSEEADRLARQITGR